jgi:hypothetical protein
MSNAAEFNQNINSIKNDFKIKKKNMKTINDKNEIYDLFLKDKGKNLKKISNLMKKEKEADIIFMKTPLHKIILKTFVTFEKLLKSFKKNGFNINIDHNDKIYLGIGCGVFTFILIVLFS